ncbi:MAG: DNA recombination/repair protein RecA, partial [Bacteroidales bacterium]|nr:DNA recombination/repair protein RecA [Bacteroidales bacterium]
ASIRLDIRRTGQLKDGDTVIGNRTKVQVVKHKVAPPFKQAEFDILYGEGISKIGEIVDLAVDFEIVKKSGSWFSYGEVKLGQGRDNTMKAFEDNPELREEIENKIREKISAK